MESPGVRKRRPAEGSAKKEAEGGERDAAGSAGGAGGGGAARDAALRPGTYWLTRIVFVRALGFVYCECCEAVIWPNCGDYISQL